MVVLFVVSGASSGVGVSVVWVGLSVGCAVMIVSGFGFGVIVSC